MAVIGVGGFGALTLQGLRASQAVRVVGVADSNPVIAQRVGKQTGVPAYSDNRSLLAETRPQAVYLAVPPPEAPALLAACAERGIHVWKEAPLARNLDEGVAMVRRMEKAGLKLAVGTQRRFARGYHRAWELRGQLGDVFLARSHYLFHWGTVRDWRGDRGSAGGGALLELGYHPIDLLVWLLGLPEVVYGTSTINPSREAPGEEKAPIHDTDDTAAAVLRYVNGTMATVVTTRCSGPVSEDLSIYGSSGSLTATGETCLLRDAGGNTLDRLSGEEPATAIFQRQAEAFAEAILLDSGTYECSARENLLNLAAIEAIYLSNRTSQPEIPRRLLETRGWSVEDCYLNSPHHQPAAPPAEPREQEAAQ